MMPALNSSAARAASGAFPALTQLRCSGVSRTEPCKALVTTSLRSACQRAYAATCAVSDAGRAIRDTGKASGFQFFDERAKALLDEGFTLAAVAGDLHTVSTGMSRRLQDFAQ